MYGLQCRSSAWYEGEKRCCHMTLMMCSLSSLRLDKVTDREDDGNQAIQSLLLRHAYIFLRPKLLCDHVQSQHVAQWPGHGWNGGLALHYGSVTAEITSEHDHAHRAGECDADHGDDGNGGSSEAHVWGIREP
jgi:hypothetical protein